MCKLEMTERTANNEIIKKITNNGGGAERQYSAVIGIITL